MAKLAFLLPALALFGLPMQATVIFSFDADAVGTSTQFTDTIGGISATFSSPTDPGGFQIQPSIFQALAGNVLGDPGPAFANDIPLAITFNQNLTAISAAFATADFGPASPFTLTAFLDNTKVGTATGTGFVLDGGTFPEGEIAFEGSTFNQVVFSSTAPDFAIDQVAVAPAPEPRLTLLIGAGLLILGAFRPDQLRKFRRPAALGATMAAGMMLAPQLGKAQANVLPLPPSQVSTVPANGDVNPYGLAFVPSSVPTGGLLAAGNLLVSNFNNVENLQGTGTTIVQVSPQGAMSLFFQSNPTARQTGLTAALGVLSSGIVVAGYLPTLDGTSATITAGGLLFIDRHGQSIGTWTSPQLRGPWGMAVYDRGNGNAQLFVSDVLSGNVARLDLTYGLTGESVAVTDMVTIGSGFPHAVDPAALVVGPSGLAFDSAHGLLYVASESDNAIYSIASAATLTASAGTGTPVYQDFVHLHAPLDLAMAPNGHFLVANSDGRNADPNQPSELVEFTPAGQSLSQFSLDPNNGGAFGLAIESVGWGTIKVAAVDDNQNAVKMWTTVVH